jgi:hypothetical protein
MVKLRPIPIEKLEVIRRSVAEATRRLVLSRSASGRRENRLRTKRGYTREHFEADALLERLTIVCRPRLDDPQVLSTITACAKRNDRRFFIRLGKNLAKSPKAQPDILGGLRFFVPRFQIQFLVVHWADDTETYPALCRLTPEGILAVLHHKFGLDKVPFEIEGLVKLRQRLGLIPLRRPKARVMLIGRRLKVSE